MTRKVKLKQRVMEATVNIARTKKATDTILQDFHDHMTTMNSMRSSNYFKAGDTAPNWEQLHQLDSFQRY